MGQVAVVDRNFAVRAFPDMHHQVATIVGHFGSKTPIGLVWAFINQHIGILVGSQMMVVKLLIAIGIFQGCAWLWSGIAAVVKAQVIGCPGGR